MANQTRNSKLETRNGDAALHVAGLACSRGGRLLFENFDLTLSHGEAIQLAGGNGRGKTTLLRTLAGLQRPVSGRVSWNSENIYAGEGYGENLLYLAHENALNPDLTPTENLTALICLHEGDASGVGRALHGFGVGAVADRLCRRLSAGQRRRAALARLYLSKADLWLLDEPAAALDADGRETLGRLIAEHVGRGGLAMFTTHEPLTLPGVSARTVTL